jgi:hypothetical protein
MRFAGSVEDGDSAIPVQLNFENPIRRVERLLYTVRHHAENERWEGFLGHFLRVKLGGKSSQFKIRLVRAQRENSAATLDCDDFAHCYWRNHIFPEPIHKSVHSPPAGTMAGAINLRPNSAVSRTDSVIIFSFPPAR